MITFDKDAIINGQLIPGAQELSGDPQDWGDVVGPSI